MQKNNVILSIFKGVLSLSIIALVCTVLLGVVNIVTQIDPLQSAYNNFAKYSGKKYDKMLEENWAGNNAKILYYAQSTDGTTNAFLSQGNGGKNGPVEVYVFVQDSKITQIELGSHDETKSYIDKLYKPNNKWVKTFFDNYLNKKIDGLSQIDFNGSGPTLSATAIQNAIMAVQSYYSQNPDKVKNQTQTTMSPASNGNFQQTKISGTDTNTTAKNTVSFFFDRRTK